MQYSIWRHGQIWGRKLRQSVMKTTEQKGVCPAQGTEGVLEVVFEVVQVTIGHHTKFLVLRGGCIFFVQSVKSRDSVAWEMIQVLASGGVLRNGAPLHYRSYPWWGNMADFYGEGS